MYNGARSIELEPTMKHIEIYTDGACSGNPGPGGWGAILRFRTSDGRVFEKELHGGEPSTTNNRMELTALLEALAAERALRHRPVFRQPVCHQRAGKGLGEGLARPRLEKGRQIPRAEPRFMGRAAGRKRQTHNPLPLAQRPRRSPGKRALRPDGGGGEQEVSLISE